MLGALLVGACFVLAVRKRTNASPSICNENTAREAAVGKLLSSKTELHSLDFAAAARLFCLSPRGECSH